MPGVWLPVSIVLLALAAGAHVVLFRMIVAESAWAAGRRRLVAAAIVVLAASPVVRVLAGVWSPLRVVGQMGLLWHLVILTAGTFLLCARALRRLVPRPASGGVEGVSPPSKPSDPGRRDVIVGGTALVASAGMYGWGAVVGRRSFEVVELSVKMPRLARALDGFTIVQLSDIHVGPWMDERDLARAVARANALKPDLVVLTGDIIDTDKRWIEAGARALAELRARFGVVGIPGNHDHYTGIEAVRWGLARGGVDMLVNRGRIIAPSDGGIAVLGVDDLWARRHGGGPDLARAKSMVPPDLPTILLAHQPPFFDEIAGQGVDLQLSGHTHGGQINPGFSPTKLLFDYVAGRYDVGGATLYVNRGLGVVGPPCRLGAAPEITKIVLASG